MWIIGLGVPGPRSSPCHVDVLHLGVEELAVALVTGAGSISANRRV